MYYIGFMALPQNCKGLTIFLHHYHTLSPLARARIFKRLRSPGIDSKERIPPAYAARRAGTITLYPTKFLAPIDCLKIPAQ